MLFQLETASLRMLLHDGKTMLKIWNLNKFAEVLGVFNCQGGGWCRETRRNKSASQFSLTISCLASPNDIEWQNGNTMPQNANDEGTYAVYMHRQKKFKLMDFTDNCEISLKPLEYELLTISPITSFGQKSVQFAPIGLANMLNSGGAVESVTCDSDKGKVTVGVKGCGEMRIFASEKPQCCMIDGVCVDFRYDSQMVIVDVPWPNPQTCLSLGMYFEKSSFGIAFS